MASAGDSVSAANFNALFTRLEAVRAAQYKRADINSTQRRNISGAISGPASRGSAVRPSTVQTLKDKLTLLANNGTGISSSFASNITVPSVGTLLRASTITAMETSVRNAEGVCANCSFFTSASSQGHFSSFFSSFFSSAAS